MAARYEARDAPTLKRVSSPYGLLLILIGCLGVGIWAATQHLAYQFAFHPNLGPPAVVLSERGSTYLRAGGIFLVGTGLTALLFRATVRYAALLMLVGAFSGAVSFLRAVYGPFHYLKWAVAYSGLSEASPYYGVFVSSLVAGGAAAAALLAGALSLRSGGEQLSGSGSHGTASWCSADHLTGTEGLLIGRQQSQDGTPDGELIRYDGEGHLVTVAPTRSGKGTGSVVPNLLTYPGSVVVTDPKGENWAVTSRRRRERLGQTIAALDPFGQLQAFGLPPSEASFNPMDIITGDNLLEGARLLADMLVISQGRGGEEQFWEEEGKALLAGLILHVATSQVEAGQPTKDRTLLEVRRLLTLPQEDFKELMRRMLLSPAAGGLVSRAAARHLQKEDRERSGVVSTAQSHTHFLDSPRMAAVLDGSSIDLSELKKGRLSVYLVLPAHHLDTYARWLRLMIASSLNAVSQEPGRPHRRVLFMLDEFANLGRMNPVLRAITLLTGYGLQVWMFLQDLSQLKGTYPKQWGTFLANADVFQTFSTNDYDTARYVSDLTGEATIFAPTASESRSRSAGKHTSRQHGTSRSFGERGRRLLLPDEVRRLPGGEQLLFIKGTNPIRARKINYLRDRDFQDENGRPFYDDNPMFDPIVGT